MLKYTQDYVAQSPEHEQIFSDIQDATGLPNDLVWLTMAHATRPGVETRIEEYPASTLYGSGELSFDGIKVGPWIWRDSHGSVEEKTYYDNQGRLHRDGGPAVITPYGDKWYHHGVRVRPGTTTPEMSGRMYKHARSPEQISEA